MEAKELRIGNLVIYNDILMKIRGITAPTPRKGIYNNEFIIELFDGAGLLDCKLDEINPIPLTEEWLIKLGFARKGNVFRLKKLTIFKVKERFYSPHSGFAYSIEIQDVHQLQNLYFALTGEELTINTSK